MSASNRVEELRQRRKAEGLGMVLMEREEELTLYDRPIGTAVLLPDDEATLSSQIITDYFSSDGPQVRWRHAPSSEFTDGSSDGSSSGSGDDEPSWRPPRGRYGGESVTVEGDKRETENKTAPSEWHVWNVGLSMLLALLVLAYYLHVLYGLVPVVLDVDL